MKVKCQNCSEKTDSPGIVVTKYYCQKCMISRDPITKEFPSKQYIKNMKLIGQWK